MLCIEYMVTLVFFFGFFFFKQKTAYEMRISDWSSDVCSSDLARAARVLLRHRPAPDAQLHLDGGLRLRAVDDGGGRFAGRRLSSVLARVPAHADRKSVV